MPQGSPGSMLEKGSPYLEMLSSFLLFQPSKLFELIFSLLFQCLLKNSIFFFNTPFYHAVWSAELRQCAFTLGSGAHLAVYKVLTKCRCAGEEPPSGWALAVSLKHCRPTWFCWHWLVGWLGPERFYMLLSTSANWPVFLFLFVFSPSLLC